MFEPSLCEVTGDINILVVTEKTMNGFGQFGNDPLDITINNQCYIHGRLGGTYKGILGMDRCKSWMDRGMLVDRGMYSVYIF